MYCVYYISYTLSVCSYHRFYVKYLVIFVLKIQIITESKKVVTVF